MGDDLIPKVFLNVLEGDDTDPHRFRNLKTASLYRKYLIKQKTYNQAQISNENSTITNSDSVNIAQLSDTQILIPKGGTITTELIEELNKNYKNEDREKDKIIVTPVKINVEGEIIEASGEDILAMLTRGAKKIIQDRQRQKRIRAQQKGEEINTETKNQIPDKSKKQKRRTYRTVSPAPEQPTNQ